MIPILKQKLILMALLALCLGAARADVEGSKQQKRMEKRVYYCEYCGHKFPDVRSLVASTCVRHPDGSNKGRHKLYEGSEKKMYTCKYCGKQFSSIMLMTGGTCPYHPKGSNKGGHAPAL